MGFAITSITSTIQNL